MKTLLSIDSAILPLSQVKSTQVQTFVTSVIVKIIVEVIIEITFILEGHLPLRRHGASSGPSEIYFNDRGPHFAPQRWVELS